MSDEIDQRKFGSIKMSYRLGTWDRGIIQEVLGVYPLDRCEFKTKTPLVFDLGAHIGTFGVICRHKWPEARIVAVEPDPGNFRFLKMNLPDGICHRLAVGDPSKSPMRVIQYCDDAEHAPREGQSAEEWGRNTGGSYTNLPSGVLRKDMQDAGAVQVVNLHWLYLKVPEIVPGIPIDILKIDCEGAEVDVIRHAKLPLNTIRYILGEVHGPKLQRGLAKLLAKTHEIEFTRPGAVLSEFFARLK